MYDIAEYMTSNASVPICYEKSVSMTREYHNYTLQINPGHHGISHSTLTAKYISDTIK